MPTSTPSQHSLFVDTAGWVDPILRNTTHHAEMESYSREIVASRRHLVTTNYVLTEVIALLTARSRLSRSQLLKFVNRIRLSTEVVHVDPDVDAEAWALLEQHADKAWSLVDAASFVVMKRLKLREAFTSDRHFVQAGFLRVP